MQAKQVSFMVVEDHDFQRDMLVKMLHAMQAKSVLQAVEGRAALEVLRKLGKPVDVIISDLDMPTMDGMEFIRHVGVGHYCNSLIIASSVERGILDAVGVMAKAYGINFLGTIEKPVTPAKIDALISAHTIVRKRVGPAAAPLAPEFSLEEIVQGLENNEFEPFFQPKVHVASGRAVGAEALARWRHPRQGIVSPYAFIAALEETGRIDALMKCMLTKSAAFCRELRARGHDSLVAVNVSIKSLTDFRIADQITAIVRQQRIEPCCVVLEITESAATTDMRSVLENLTRLRMKGFELSIDDYGTGYSSLEQLTRIPFQELKIDQSFVTHADEQASARVILESSLDMARRLRLRAVAEGVETQANWDMLVELNCDIAQGYYLSRPLPAAVYLEWLKAWVETPAGGISDIALRALVSTETPLSKTE